MRKKVTLLVGVFPPAIGGPAIFAERFQRWCKSRNIQCQVITYCFTQPELSSGVAAVKLTRLRIYSFLKFVFQVVKHSRDSSLVLANGCFLEMFLASFFRRRDYIVKLPGDAVWEIARNRNLTSLDIEEFQNSRPTLILRVLRLLFSFSYKRAKMVICPSKQLSSFALNWGVDPHKIRIIYNSVDPEVFSNQESDNPEFDLVTICRLVKWKNVDELIRLSASRNLSLAVAGDGPEMSRLRKLSIDLGAQVTFLGEIENQLVPELLSRSKCFVLNSDFEATSYSLIEAKMMGVPVIARSSAGSCEVIRDGIDGFLVSDMFEMQIAVDRALSNAKSKLFSEAARQDAKNRFNQDINFAEIIRLSGDLCE
jgi:glycosyltransferase involved in cell wall biosynthesis